MGGHGRKDGQGHDDGVRGILQKPFRNCSACALGLGSLSAIFPGLGTGSTVSSPRRGEVVQPPPHFRRRPQITAITALLRVHPPSSLLPPWIHLLSTHSGGQRRPREPLAALELPAGFGSPRRVWLPLGRVLRNQGRFLGGGTSPGQ